jgi:hypothetical protein
MPRLLGHLRSNAIAYVALFVALGGTAYAAVNLPPNSVGTEQLKNSAVTKKKIKRNAVTTKKVRDATLRKQDFAPGVLVGGPKGPTGPSGATGPTGGVDTEILWAVVKAGDATHDPVLVYNRHAVSVTRVNAGYYEVKFDRAVDTCAAEVSFGGSSGIFSPGFTSTPFTIRTERKGGAADTLIVAENQAKSPPDGADNDFHLLVAC